MKYIFNSRVLTLTIVLKPSSRMMTGTQVVKIPGLSAHFVNGLWQTENEEAAGLLRNLIQKGQAGEVIELTNIDELVYQPKKTLNRRQAIAASETSKGLNPTAVAEKPAESESFDCVICQKKFKTQKALNMHLVSHRPGVQIEQPVAPVAEKSEA